MPDCSHHGEGKHDKRDMTMPAVPGAGFVVSEAEFIFGGLEAVLNGPTAAFGLNQRVDGGPRRAPGREEGKIAIGDVVPDQHAPGPEAVIVFVVFLGFKVSAFAIAPVMPSRALGPGSR